MADQPSDRARKAMAVCEHGIRWPWACHECDAADPMRPLYAAIRNLTPAPREDRNEEPSALVTVGEPNGGDHEHGRVTGQAGASVPAAQTASEGLDTDALIEAIAAEELNNPPGNALTRRDMIIRARAALSAIRPTLDADRAYRSETNAE